MKNACADPQRAVINTTSETGAWKCRVWLMPLSTLCGAGNGFVDAVILGENGIPSAETLAAVQAHVDAVRPVTRKNGFLALAPSIQTVNVAVTITLSSGTDTDTATAAIKSAVNAYFDALDYRYSYPYW